MHRRHFRPAAMLLAGTALFLACGPASAQQSGAAAEDRFANVEIKAENLAPGVAVLFGAGGNIGVSHGEDGTVLIDDQLEGLTPKIVAAVDKLGADPARFLINTHWHYDHTGGNEVLGAAGALILAHENVRIRLLGEQESGNGNDPASPKVALPVVTYHDGIKLHLNGDEIRIMHVPHGHTDGDSIVIWEKANVIHMGDLYFNKVTLPFIDLNSGGNALGVLAGAEKALAIADYETQIIPGHGPMATKADLQAYRDMLADVIGKVRTAREDGKTLAEVQAMKPAAKYDTNPDAFIKGDAFVEAVYNSFDAEKEHPHDHD